jgi:hypothetical protein
VINAIKFSIEEIEASDQYFDHTTAGNWEAAEFEPPLSTVGECVAQKAISSLPESYALADGE